MSTDFNPTHRTNRAIGKIEAGSPIRVARYDDPGFFSDVLGQLGVKNDHIEYRYWENDVRFWDVNNPGPNSKYALPGNYIITDGKNFEVTATDSGWSPLSARHVSGTEDVVITFHETYYCIHGKESGTTLRMTPKDILLLADRIKDLVPEPSPIKDARFIHARFVLADEYRTLAKIDGAWYDHNGEEYTEKQVLDIYDEIEVIR